MTKRYIAVVVECEDDAALAAIQAKGEGYLPLAVDRALIAVPRAVARVLPGLAYFDAIDRDERPGRWTRLDQIGRPERPSERAMRLADEEKGKTS